jgi:dTDP-4-dehydrorhamnose reductase
MTLPTPIPARRSILLTGASGQLGSELAQILGPLGPVHAFTRETLDLTSKSAIRKLVRQLNPRWIVNAAAYTAVDRAESEKSLAHAVNATAPRILGEEGAKIGAAVLHVSTDYVFPGTGNVPHIETDPTGPTNVYGATKLAGEQALAATGAAHIILRTSWVYGPTGRNFLRTILRAAREKVEMTIVADQHGAPTWARDLARAIATILVAAPDADSARAFQGIYHAAGHGETTWFGFASEALRLRAIQEPATPFANLLPIPTEAYPTPATRPLNSRLDCTKLQQTFGFQFPEWQQSLEEVLKEIPLT